MNPETQDPIAVWFASLTAMEWVGLIVGAILIILLLCRVFGISVLEILAAILDAFT